MKYHILFATETRCEAYGLVRAINNRFDGSKLALVARPERGALKKPYRYIVLTTSETLTAHRDILRDVRDSVRPPRHPKLQLVKEWGVDATVAGLELLTRIVRRLKGTPGKSPHQRQI